MSKFGPAAEQVDDTYQHLLDLDANKGHHNNYEEHQDITGKEYNNLSAIADNVLGHVEGHHVQQQQPLVKGDIVAATVAAMQAANGQAGPKKIGYHLKPKMLEKEFTTSELRIWCNRRTFFWDAHLMDTRVEQVRWANFFDCMHTSLETYYKPKMPGGIGICTASNADDPLADHRKALSIMQTDHQTTWPIHNRTVNLFKEEQKEEQSFDMWQVSLYTLGEDANVDDLTGKDWLLFLLIQNCCDPMLKKKIFDLDDNSVTLENVQAVARRHEKGERACKQKETISNIFIKKEGKPGKAMPSQPVQQPQSTQSLTNAKANTSGAKKQCNRCGDKHTTYEHRQSCPAKDNTCSSVRRRATAQSSATTGRD
jgi:hypothetical protein